MVQLFLSTKDVPILLFFGLKTLGRYYFWTDASASKIFSNHHTIAIMKLVSVLNGQAIRFIRMKEPIGGIYLLDEIDALKKQYGFLGMPDSLEDCDISKGVTFEHGKLAVNRRGESGQKEILIKKLQVYTSGVLVQTKSSVEDAEAIIDDLGRWAVQTLGYQIPQNQIIKCGRLSEVEVELDPRLNTMFGVLKPFTERLNELLDEETIFDLPEFGVSSFSLHCDTTKTELPTPSSFIIEKRVGEPYSSNLYFSSAPLTTRNHLILLQELEDMAAKLS